MSRTNLDPSALARSLRRMSGDGSIEWVMEPIQASVLLDVADLLDENAKLRELVADTLMQPRDYCQKYGIEYDSWDSVNNHLNARMRELGIEADR